MPQLAMPQTLPRELNFFLDFFAIFLLKLLPILEISYNFATSNKMFNKHYYANDNELSPNQSTVRIGR